MFILTYLGQTLANKMLKTSTELKAESYIGYIHNQSANKAIYGSVAVDADVRLKKHIVKN